MTPEDIEVGEDSSGKRRGQDFKMIPGHDSEVEVGEDSSGTSEEPGNDSSGNKTGQDF